MIHFRALGGARLTRDGRAITGRAAQRHPVALLALLAAAPGGTISRDKLVAYLWQDHESRKARHRLSVALHVLRRKLGRSSITSEGDALRLDPAAVWTDVVAFTASMEEGRLEDAVHLYAGPFLDGFFLGGAPAFDRWVDGERDRLAGLYAEALEQLAREAQGRGDATGAADYWKRLGAHDPYSSRIAVEVVHALDTAGDRIGALRHARAHAALVTTELGVEPDPEILEWCARLASDAPGPPHSHGGQAAAATGSPATADAPEPGPRPVPGVAPDDGRRRGPRLPRRRITAGAGLAATVAALVVALSLAVARGGGAEPGSPLLVAAVPFAPLGDDADAARLGEGLADRVLSTLAYVPALDVVPGGGSRQARSPGPGGLLRGGPRADAVIEGSVERRGEVLRVTVRLTDPATERTRWIGRYDRPGGDPAGLQEEVSLAISDDLRGRLAPFRPKVYTENERAYDRFLQGVYAHRRMTREDLWKALQFYREAVEEDTAFALAHAISANAYLGLTRSDGDPDVAFERAREHALRSLQLDSTLAEGHAALAMIRIWRDRDFAAGERSLRRAAMLYPTLPQVRGAYGDYLLLVRNRPAAALRSYRQALELDPLNAARSYVIERALYLARRYDEVIDQNRVTRAIGPHDEFTYHGAPVADAYRELGRFDEAAAAYRRLHERAGGPPPAGLAVLHARTGRTAEALAIARELERGAGASAGGWPAIAAVHAALGDADRAFAWLEGAYAARAPEIVTLRADPAFDPIRSDPRFEELRRRIGLAP